MKPSTPWIWYGSAIAALLLCSWFFSIRPAKERRLALTNEIQQKELVTTEMIEATARIRQSSAEAKLLKTELTAFDLRLRPIAGDSLLQDLWELAASNEVQVRSVKAPARKKLEKLSERNIEIRLGGSFDGVYHFLLGLESAPRITRVQKLSLSKPKQAENQVQAEMLLSFVSQTAN